MNILVKAFFDKYKAAYLFAAFVCISTFASGQTVDTVRPYQSIYARPGYEWEGGRLKVSLVLPRDTFKLRAADSGALAYKAGRVWQWSGVKWDTLKATAGGVGETTTAGNWIRRIGNQYSWPGPISADAYASGATGGNPTYGFRLDSMYYFRVGTGKLEIYMQPEASNDVKIGPVQDINYDSSLYWSLFYAALSHRNIRIAVTDSLNFTGSLPSITDTNRNAILTIDKVSGKVGKAASWPAGGSGTTNLDTVRTATSITVTSSTGVDAVIPLADIGSNKAGLLSPGFAKDLQDSVVTHISTQGDSITCYYRNNGTLIKCDTAYSLLVYNSIEAVGARGIQLKNDQASPGANKVYGTDASGVKGWKNDPAGGSGSPAGSNTQVQFNSSSAFGADGDFTYNSTTNKINTDSIGLHTGRAKYWRVTADNSTQHKIILESPFPTRPPAGIYYNGTIVNGDTNTVISIGHNFDGAKPNDGYIRLGIEQKYPPYPGALFRWKEFHTPEIGLIGGPVYRPGSWEGRDDLRAGTWTWRADGYNFLAADGKSTGSNDDSVFTTINNNGISSYIYEGGDGIKLTHRRWRKYMVWTLDSTNNRANITSDAPNLYLNSAGTVYIGNTLFRNPDATTGSDNSFGSIAIRTAANADIDFVTGGVWNRAKIRFTQHYGELSLNHPYGVRGHDGANNGVVMFFDDRNGTADPFRMFVANTSGTAVQALGVANDGHIGFGTPGSTESYLFKTYGNTSGTTGIAVNNSSSTSLLTLKNNGLLSLPQIGLQSLDTTNYKLVVVNSSGDVYKTNWQTAGAGSGITSLNSQTGSSQTFATPGTSGTAPNWSSSSNIHTLNIPIMDNAGVTAGLLSNGAQDIPGVKNFLSKPTGGGSVTGQSFETGNLGISSSSTVSIKLAPSNSVSDKMGFQAGTGYWQFGIHDPNVFGGTASTEGAGIYLDSRGITGVIRFAATNTSGTTTYSSITPNGSLSIGTSTNTATAWLDIAAGTTSRAQLYLASSSAPSSPVNGSIWNESGVLKYRVSGSTRDILHTGSTVAVANGGTGLTSTTAYGLIAGGTTSTGNFQNVGTGSSGQVLKSNGSSALPSFTDANGLFASARTTSLTFTYTTNVSATSSVALNYMRVGDMIQFWGTVVINPTASGAFELGMAFPIASGISNADEVAGTGVCKAFVGEPIEITGDVANARFKISGNASNNTSRTYVIHGSIKYIAP